MCVNCGCGEYDKRHKPSDITLDDLQAAARGQNMDVEQAADNIHQAARDVRARQRKPSSGRRFAFEAKEGSHAWQRLRRRSR